MIHPDRVIVKHFRMKQNRDNGREGNALSEDNAGYQPLGDTNSNHTNKEKPAIKASSRTRADLSVRVSPRTRARPKPKARPRRRGGPRESATFQPLKPEDDTLCPGLPVWISGLPSGCEPPCAPESSSLPASVLATVP